MCCGKYFVNIRFWCFYFLNYFVFDFFFILLISKCFRFQPESQVVSAAPSTQSASILEIRSSLAFTNAYKQLMVYRENRGCIRSVVDNAFIKSDMAALWNSFLFKLDQTVNEWNRAQTIEDKSEELK